MNKAYLAGFLLALVLFCTAPTKADSIATIDLSANFATGGSFVSVTFPTSAPLFGVTGQFTVDEDTGAISSWNVNFLGSLGASYQLSAQNGGIASASCVGVTPCPGPPSSFDQGYWDFSFANSGAFLKIDTLQRPPSSSPFFTGETLQLCPVEITFYPGNVSDDSPTCVFTSSASFDGETGFCMSGQICPLVEF